ncbi:MBL fold metallo-hydrolase [Euzebya tangerina]|uniref:MBL fold metallo-hydrolase n=1 Tax=Euzebya tangerina TaxID=591198 RepID=UPI000E318AA8|nr:MBL fold metallo-hydrolase [Euzebya tangerina]
MARYSIWLVQTGIMAEFPRSGIFYGQHNAGTLEVPLGFVVVKGEGHLVVVDTGYDWGRYGEELTSMYGVTNPGPPPDQLRRLDLEPDEVDHVLLTHAHWDHMGFLDAFPNATVHLQRHELDGWVANLSKPPRHGFLHTGVDPVDFRQLMERTFAGKVVLHEGPIDHVLPGIHLRTAFDGHTHGGQYVIMDVDTADGVQRWAAVGDAIFCLENLTGSDGSGVYVPVGGATGSQSRVLATYDDVLGAVGGDPHRIVPVHDLDAYQRFPSTRLQSGLHIAEVTLADDEPSRIAAAV